MREEAARKLTRAIWRQRVRTWGASIVLAILAVGAAGWLMELRIARMDPATEAATVDATVLSARRLPTRASVSVAHVRTDTGEEVDADSQLGVVLQPDERVALSRVRHASGKVTYHVTHVIGLP